MAEKESKCCRTCKWYSDEVCCNGDSRFRADFRSEYQICEKWDGIQKELQKRKLSLCEYRNMFGTNPNDDLKSGKTLSAFEADWFVCEVDTYGKEQGTVTLMEARIYGGKQG